MMERPRCVNCGRFFNGDYAWKMVYSGALPEPDHEIYRCASCLGRLGPFHPDDRVKPEFSCGVARTHPQVSGTNPKE